MRVLPHIYDTVKNRSRTDKTVPVREADSSIGSGKRGPLILHRARIDRIRLRQLIRFLSPAAASRSESEVPLKRRSLIPDFDCTKVPDAASAVPTILAEDIFPSAAEAAQLEGKGTAGALSLSILLILI
jgi:hypothetical protein